LAIELAGGDPRIVHVNELRSGRARFADHAAVLLPGGFSYGDALGAGTRLALELKAWFAEEMASAIRSGRPVLGICNGFQALVKACLLAGPPEASGGRRVTLAPNLSGRFECRWVTVAPQPGCRASWISELAEPIHCPVAHGEGRVAVSHPDVIHAIEERGLVAFRYVTPEGEPAEGRHPLNPNGSVNDVAGMCDPTGVVVGLMPHPEDHVVAWQRPHGGDGRRGSPLFEAFVDAAR
ncbi:MAG: phosphoribosylformylglycinamidine synthase subunit PurQ, partial [Acidimicrobiales bacterium]